MRRDGETCLWDWEFGGLQESLGLGRSRPPDHECGTAHQERRPWWSLRPRGVEGEGVWPPLPSCDLCSPPSSPALGPCSRHTVPSTSKPTQRPDPTGQVQVACPCLRPAPCSALHPGRPQAAQPAACGRVAPPAHSAHTLRRPQAGGTGHRKVCGTLHARLFSDLVQTILSWFPFLRFLFLLSPPPCLPPLSLPPPHAPGG